MPGRYIKRCIKNPHTAMLTSSVLTPSDYARFATFNELNNGAAVDPAYLQQARLRVFYRTEAPDRWVAGYAVNARPPFRYLGVLEPGLRARTLRQHGLPETDLVEITLLSRDHSLSWTPGERMVYYTMSLLDALQTGRRVVLGGTVEEIHRKRQMVILDRLLYKGELNFFGSSKDGWLYYATRWRIVGNLLRYGINRLLNYLTPSPSVGKPVARPAGSLPNTQ